MSITATSRPSWTDLIQQQQNNLVSKLPYDLIRLILSYLNFQDIQAVCLTCRGLTVVAYDDHLWRSFFNRRFHTPMPAETLSKDGACVRAYQVMHRLHSNLSRGVFGTTTLKEWTLKRIISIQGHLITGSGPTNGDYQVKSWNTDEKKPHMALNGPRGLAASKIGHNSCTFLICNEGNPLSGIINEDHEINLWDLESGKFTRTLKGHTGKTIPPIVANGDLISGSYDTTIKIWDLKSGECKKTLIGHEAPISILIAEGKYLYSGSDDKTIKLWDLENGKCLWTFNGHKGAITCLLVTDPFLISGSTDTSIKIWDIETGDCVKTLKWHSKPPRFLVFAEGFLISSTDSYKSGSDEYPILIWDIKSGNCVKALKELVSDNHKPEVIHSLLWINGNLICGTQDCIRMWNFVAPDDVVFAEIAELLKKDRGELALLPSWELKRFSCMPQKSRIKIYEELLQILKPIVDVDLQRAEAIFNNDAKVSLRTYDKIKALAIENYLNPTNRRNPEDPYIIVSLEPKTSLSGYFSNLPYRVFTKAMDWLFKE